MALPVSSCYGHGAYESNGALTRTRFRFTTNLAFSYGVFQEYYSDNWKLQGSHEVTGIIGTTSNGVMYLSMPFLFALFTKRWARGRQTALAFGFCLPGCFYESSIAVACPTSACTRYFCPVSQSSLVVNVAQIVLSDLCVVPWRKYGSLVRRSNAVRVFINVHNRKVT